MGSRSQSPRSGGIDTGGSSIGYRRGHEDEQLSLGRTIRATTTIDVEEHSSHAESMSIDRDGGGLGQEGAVYRMQEIELGTTTNRTICERAWS